MKRQRVSSSRRTVSRSATPMLHSPSIAQTAAVAPHPVPSQAPHQPPSSPPPPLFLRHRQLSSPGPTVNWSIGDEAADTYLRVHPHTAGIGIGRRSTTIAGFAAAATSDLVPGAHQAARASDLTTVDPVGGHADAAATGSDWFDELMTSLQNNDVRSLLLLLERTILIVLTGTSACRVSHRCTRSIFGTSLRVSLSIGA